MGLFSKSTTTIRTKYTNQIVYGFRAAFTVATGFVIDSYQSVYPLSFSFPEFATYTINDGTPLTPNNVIISGVATLQIIAPLRFHQ